MRFWKKLSPEQQMATTAKAKPMAISIAPDTGVYKVLTAIQKAHSVETIVNNKTKTTKPRASKVVNSLLSAVLEIADENTLNTIAKKAEAEIKVDPTSKTVDQTVEFIQAVAACRHSAAVGDIPNDAVAQKNLFDALLKENPSLLADYQKASKT